MPLPGRVKVTAVSGGSISSLVLTTAGKILARGVKNIAPPHGVKLPTGLIATVLASGSTAVHALVVLRRSG